MSTENYKPCPFCNNQPKRHPSLSGIGFINSSDDDRIFMVACATDTCPIKGMYMGDATWNSHSVSKEAMAEWGVKTQRPEDIKGFEEKLKKYFSEVQM
ncbi:hypothetical protein [Klebsiella oxytoca]|uniref:hypothetical protein n=1 Tax=Klebsiella oxytoca TaxID=571 RepID=UPI000DFA4D81|nr:hypothetical protein [Klebsiella oxytoca]STR23994.1 Uncharacterised protein [Klebsiella oxytoca]